MTALLFAAPTACVSHPTRVTGALAAPDGVPCPSAAATEPQLDANLPGVSYLPQARLLPYCLAREESPWLGGEHQGTACWVSRSGRTAVVFRLEEAAATLAADAETGEGDRVSTGELRPALLDFELGTVELFSRFIAADPTGSRIAVTKDNEIWVVEGDDPAVRTSLGALAAATDGRTGIRQVGFQASGGSVVYLVERRESIVHRDLQSGSERVWHPSLGGIRGIRTTPVENWFVVTVAWPDALAPASENLGATEFKPCALDGPGAVFVGCTDVTVDPLASEAVLVSPSWRIVRLAGQRLPLDDSSYVDVATGAVCSAESTECVGGDLPVSGCRSARLFPGSAAVLLDCATGLRLQVRPNGPSVELRVGIDVVGEGRAVRGSDQKRWVVVRVHDLRDAGPAGDEGGSLRVAGSGARDATGESDAAAYLHGASTAEAARAGRLGRLCLDDGRVEVGPLVDGIGEVDRYGHVLGVSDLALLAFEVGSGSLWEFPSRAGVREAVGWVARLSGDRSLVVSPSRSCVFETSSDPRNVTAGGCIVVAHANPDGSERGPWALSCPQ